MAGISKMLDPPPDVIGEMPRPKVRVEETAKRLILDASAKKWKGNDACSGLPSEW
jgi:hypothetical protein